jgi:hypothetical protein
MQEPNMFKVRLFKRRAAVALCALFLVAAGVVLWMPGLLFPSTQPVPHWRPTGPVRQIQPRDSAADNSETLRILHRDDMFNLTRLEVFKLQSQIQINKDPVTHRTTDSTVNMKNGTTLTMKADKAGQQVASAILADAAGEPVVSLEKIDGSKTKTVVALADGMRSVEIVKGGTSIITIGPENGQPLMEITYDGSRRTGLKLFSPTGRLIYSDVMTAPPGIYGQPAQFVGTVYGPPDGQPSHKLSLRQSLYEDVPGTIVSIDVLAADGQTVTFSVTNATWQGADQYPLSGFENQSKLELHMKEALGSAKRVDEQMRTIIATTTILLADRTQ